MFNLRGAKILKAFFFVSKISIPRKIRLAKQGRATIEGRGPQT